jgi:hypothetical protein
MPIERIGTGKWREPNVPHRGWTCINIEDLGEQEHVCEMCEVMLVRFVHTMSHPDYGTLDVGCVCAGHMEEDLIGARKREASFKNRSSRRAHWLTREWRTSYAGNDYINTDGFNIVVYPTGETWGACVTHRDSGQQRFSKRPYLTAEHAKLAAFDAMLQMKLHLEPQ